MSFHALFFFDGGNPKGYQVIASGLGFAQNVDDVGKPSSEVCGSMIALRLQPTEDNALVEWSSDAFEHRNGRIEYYRNDQESIFKEISFVKGYCSHYRENFNPNERQGSLVTDVYITAETTTVQGVTHRNSW